MAFNISDEQNLLLHNDRIIWQFPMYWYSSPAILKKWEDDVLTNRFVFGNFNNKSSLENKSLGLVVNTGESYNQYKINGREGFSVLEILRPYQLVAKRLKMSYLDPFVFYKFEYMSDIDQQKLYINYQQYLTMKFPNSFSQKATWLANKLKKVNINDKLKFDLQNILLQNKIRLDDLRSMINNIQQ